MSYLTIRNEIARLAAEDFVGLWEVVKIVRIAKTGTSDIPEPALAVIRDLLSNRILKAGIPDRSGGFSEWPGTVDEIVARIANEWRQLGRSPDIGEIVWFAASSET